MERKTFIKQLQNFHVHKEEHEKSDSPESYPWLSEEKYVELSKNHAKFKCEECGKRILLSVILFCRSRRMECPKCYQCQYKP